VIFSALTVACVMPGVIAVARRMIAFRADYAGITVSVTRNGPAAFRRSTAFIPWGEVDAIVLYPACGRGRCGDALIQGIAVQGIAVQLRKGTTVAGRDVIAPGMARTITGWKLDSARLTAVTAAVAPGIPVINTGEPGYSG
jgi:hypothetical protein